VCYSTRQEQTVFGSRIFSILSNARILSVHTVCECVECVARSSKSLCRRIVVAPQKLTKSSDVFVDLHLITRNWLIGVHVSVCQLIWLCKCRMCQCPVPAIWNNQLPNTHTQTEDYLSFAAIGPIGQPKANQSPNHPPSHPPPVSLMRCQLTS
jgi:hypothetical protein